MNSKKVLAELRAILERGQTVPGRDEFLGGKGGSCAFRLQTGTEYAPLEPKYLKVEEWENAAAVGSDPDALRIQSINDALSQVEWIVGLFIRHKNARLQFESAERLHQLNTEIVRFGQAVGEIGLLPSEWRLLEQFLNKPNGPGYGWSSLHPKPPKEVNDLRLPFVWMEVIGGAAGHLAEGFQMEKSTGPALRPASELGATPEHDLAAVAWFLAYRFHGPPSKSKKGYYMLILSNIVRLIYSLPEFNGSGDTEALRFQMNIEPGSLSRNQTVTTIHRELTTWMTTSLRALCTEWASQELNRFESAVKPGRRVTVHRVNRSR